MMLSVVHHTQSTVEKAFIRASARPLQASALPLS